VTETSVRGQSDAEESVTQSSPTAAGALRAGLYTPAERQRRDASPWTLVQGVLAPLQFLVFLVSLGLVLRYLSTGEGYTLAVVSIVIKTLVLYTIMVTGAIWEKDVFGVYLFARPFFWEDVFSMAVLALHSAYLVALATGALAPRELMWLALAAYATYVINAGQFVLKLRAARLQATAAQSAAPGSTAAQSAAPAVHAPAAQLARTVTE
jgi:3-vinyl bacteriochlorophyllide hydratase